MKKTIPLFLCFFVLFSCLEKQVISTKKLQNKLRINSLKGKFNYHDSVIEFIPLNDSTIQQKFIINEHITYDLELNIYKKVKDSIFFKTNYKHYYLSNKKIKNDINLVVLKPYSIHYYDDLSSSPLILTPLK